MQNNYVQHEYEACHLVYASDQGINCNIYLGDVSSALDIDFIHRSNITTVVTAAASMDQVSYKQEDNINHIIYSVLDHKSQNLIRYFDELYELVQAQIKNGSILVHCAAGISRVIHLLHLKSSTLVISYLMKKNSWTFKQAIKYVRKSRPMVLPNLGFERQLKQYQKVLSQHHLQHRRIKPKTSQQNKHKSDNNCQLLPEIGLKGQASMQKKIHDCFRIYKKEQDNQKISKKNTMHNLKDTKNQIKINILKYQQVQKYQSINREFGQTKSTSLQHVVEYNLKNYGQVAKMSPYLQLKTDQNQVVSSRKCLASRNNLFDAAIIPIKYSTTNKQTEKLRKTHIQFANLNNNNINIDRLNIFRQKNANNNALLPGGQNNANQNMDFNLNNNKSQVQNSLMDLRTRNNFLNKAGKVKPGPNQITNNVMFMARKQMTPMKKQTGTFKRQIQSFKRGQYAIRNQQHKPKKLTIKNFLFHQQQ